MWLGRPTPPRRTSLSKPRRSRTNKSAAKTSRPIGSRRRNQPSQRCAPSTSLTTSSSGSVRHCRRLLSGHGEEWRSPAVMPPLANLLLASLDLACIQGEQDGSFTGRPPMAQGHFLRGRGLPSGRRPGLPGESHNDETPRAGFPARPCRPTVFPGICRSRRDSPPR